MKVQFITSSIGALTVLGSDVEDFETTEIPFIEKNMMSWYPLNTNYDYVYSDNKIYPVKLPGTKRLADLHLKNIEDISLDTRAGTSKWNVETIKKDNEEAIKRADELNIPIWSDYPDIDTIHKAFSVLGDHIDSLLLELESEHSSKLSLHRSIRYQRLPQSNKRRVALKCSDAESDKNFLIYGKIYNMLKLMSKRAAKEYWVGGIRL